MLLFEIQSKRGVTELDLSGRLFCFFFSYLLLPEPKLRVAQFYDELLSLCRALAVAVAAVNLLMLIGCRK